MATTGYAAALDSNDVIMSYGAEAVWATKPAVAFQKIRMDSEGFSSSKSRTRPNEINADGQASGAITTKVESPGSINYSVSSGTHNDLIASSIGGAFTTALANMAGLITIAATATGFTDTGGGFIAGNNFSVGQMIKISGFTANSGENEGVYRIDAITDANTIATTPTPAGVEAAGDSVTIKGSMCRNGKAVQSFFFQKELATSLFLQYAGAWPTGGSLDVGVGDYLKGTLAFLNKSEAKATVTGSTGAEVAAPTGDVIDSINGIGSVYRNGTAMDVVIQKVGVKWNKEGARSQFGIGSADAQGIGNGKLQVDGSLSSYFKDFTLYDEFIAETSGPIWFQALDTDGVGYCITFCNANIMNPKIVAGGSSQDIMADFEIEGKPESPSSIYGGMTIQIDYFD